MTNFDFLLEEKQFASFAEIAIAAEKIYHIDHAACVINCRRAMEFAVKWLYSVDEDLEEMYDDRLAVLLDDRVFRDLVGRDIWRRLDSIRKTGNSAAHSDQRVTAQRAGMCLKNLFIFLDFVAYCYCEGYERRSFDRSLLDSHEGERAEEGENDEVEKLRAENLALRRKLSDRRRVRQQTYIPAPLELTEPETRRLYIDVMLSDSGWIEGEDWRSDMTIPGVGDDVGKADYILYDGRKRPIAVIEAVSSGEEVTRGRRKARLIADALEKRYGRRPFIYMTNGFETVVDDGVYPERQAASVPSKADMERMISVLSGRISLERAGAQKKIAGRWYQKKAVRAVCDAFDGELRRRALITMAPGAGKTHVAAALCDLLIRSRWVKNILYLSDRDTLVTQAKRLFDGWLPNVTTSVLDESPESCRAQCVFSTYSSAVAYIDQVRQGGKRLLTGGHFDLVICDEANIGVHSRYRDLFGYFDALLVGLSSLPSDEMGADIFDIYGIRKSAPTFSYDLDRAVADGYLVDYKALHREDAGLESDKDISDALALLLEKGQKVGGAIGKTVIFASDREQAERIYEVFGRDCPAMHDMMEIIEEGPGMQKLVDEFADAASPLRIAVTVDLFDAGIDIPPVLNIAFFRRVRSRTSFWQMLGRGTRLCPGLVDGKDKERFLVFDFGGNFSRFERRGLSAKAVGHEGRRFEAMVRLLVLLRKEPMDEKQAELAEETAVRLAEMVRELDKENFAVRQHLKYAETYSDKKAFENMSDKEAVTVTAELAPLMMPGDEPDGAAAFDSLICSLMSDVLEGKEDGRLPGIIGRIGERLLQMSHIPEVRELTGMLEQLTDTEGLLRTNISGLEALRLEIRDMVYLIMPEEAEVF